MQNLAEPQINSTPVKASMSWASVVNNTPQLSIESPLNTIKISTPTAPSKKKLDIVKTSILSNEDYVKIGKTLSWMLRHGVKECNLTMREDAYVPLSEVLDQTQMEGVNESDILHIVDINSKKRYEVLVENNIKYIRATQGHSKSVGDHINQEQLMKVITTPYEKCLHGTNRKSWELIKKTGLKRMARQHIHLINSEPSDKNVVSGARSSSTVLIYIDMARAMADGIVFYLSSNGVILTEGVDGTLDPKYFIDVGFKN